MPYGSNWTDVERKPVLDNSGLWKDVAKSATMDPILAVRVDAIRIISEICCAWIGPGNFSCQDQPPVMFFDAVTPEVAALLVLLLIGTTDSGSNEVACRKEGPYRGRTAV